MNCKLKTGAFILYPNYPNPFNPNTNISYSIPRESPVKIIIYDLLGREISRIVDEVKTEGLYKVQWDGRNTYGLNVSSGVYIYRLITDIYSYSRKMVLLR